MEHNNPTRNDHSAVAKISDHQQPSCSDNPPEIIVASHSRSSTTTAEQASASASASALALAAAPAPAPALASASVSSPNIKHVNQLHYSILLHNNILDLETQIIRSTQVRTSNFVCESDSSTLLHIAASVGQLDFIEELRLRSEDPLITKPNSEGDLPLHVAAKAFQHDVVKKLVDMDSTSCTLGTGNNSGDTALHIALENHHHKMARFLFDKCRHTFYLCNSEGFSPLYLAIKAEFWDIASDMLSEKLVTTESRTGLVVDTAKSVIHAAITAKKRDILYSMLRNYNKEIANKTDEMERTPLSYAAYTGFLEGVECIIKQFPYQAYKNRGKNGYFPIHWACSGGYMSVVKWFFHHDFPIYVRFLLNNKKQNILHVAAAKGKAEVVEYILQHQVLETLINMKDANGNTPLHLASKRKYPRVVYALTWDHRVKLGFENKTGCTALDIAEKCIVGIPFQQRLTWLCLRYAGTPRARELHHSNCINNTSSDPETFVNDNNKSCTNQQTNSSKNNYKERINTLLVVSILVTTVTYASGFTVPGGYNNNAPYEGMATLAHKIFFQVFVISNIIAMYTSILAAMALIWAQLDDLELVLFSLQVALPLLGIALTMMCVAFMAGLYVVIFNVVSWLSILVLVVAGLFLVALLLFYIPFCLPFPSIKNTILRYVFHVLFTITLFACEKGGKST